MDAAATKHTAPLLASDATAWVPHVSTGASYAPEDSPFTTLFADITHRCNMACPNCYIPNRDIPDMDADWLYGILARLPRRTRIRLVGAEPTLRRDLPAIIRRVRALGHLPIVLSNGLSLAKRDYVRKLKRAGLRTVHLSMDGGLRDDLYEAITGMACAGRKLRALENLCAENFFVTVGIILVNGLNVPHIGEFLDYLRQRRAVREIHFRSIGAMGRHMDTGRSPDLAAMEALVGTALGIRVREADSFAQPTATSIDFRHDGVGYQLTQWPDLNNHHRGRITPAGRIEPCFEHLIANEGGY